MYEAKTYEVILQQMLDAVIARNPNIDTREGSIIYNALAPAAVELASMYIALDHVLNESFADTADREFLVKRAAERGIIAEQATNAIRQGEFTPSNIQIPIGSRFSLNVLNYIVTEKISDGVYKLKCETTGEVGNAESGRLIPIDYVEGLETAELTEVLIPGENEESADELRVRYFESLSSQAFGGNITDYKEKTNAIPGVGGVKVYPVWDGGGTVKLVIIDSTYGIPSDVLVATVQNEIDPVGHQGTGMGIAPIGHIVTVDGVESTTVNISLTATLETGWTWEDVLPYVQDAVDKYFLELAKDWDNETAIVVRISQIETRLLDLVGILDISDTKLNGVAQNLQLGGDNIPVRGTITNV